MCGGIILVAYLSMGDPYLLKHGQIISVCTSEKWHPSLCSHTTHSSQVRTEALGVSPQSMMKYMAMVPALYRLFEVVTAAMSSWVHWLCCGSPEDTVWQHFSPII